MTQKEASGSHLTGSTRYFICCPSSDSLTNLWRSRWLQAMINSQPPCAVFLMGWNLLTRKPKPAGRRLPKERKTMILVLSWTRTQKNSDSFVLWHGHQRAETSGHPWSAPLRNTEGTGILRLLREGNYLGPTYAVRNASGNPAKRVFGLASAGTFGIRFTRPRPVLDVVISGRTHGAIDVKS